MIRKCLRVVVCWMKCRLVLLVLLLGKSFRSIIPNRNRTLWSCVGRTGLEDNTGKTSVTRISLKCGIAKIEAFEVLSILERGTEIDVYGGNRYC